MRSETSSNHQCPSCHGEGRSVASMNYAETQEWKRETGITLPDKPTPVYTVTGNWTVDVFIVLFLSLFVSLGILSLSSDMQAFSSGNHNPAWDSWHAIGMLGKTAGIFTFVLGIGTALRITSLASKNEKEEKMYVERRKHIEDLYYCESCHILYDDNKQQAAANDAGFQSLVNPSP